MFVTAVALCARFVHLAAAVVLVGSVFLLVLAGRGSRATVAAWQARIMRSAGALALTALGAGLVALAAQAAILEDRPAAALELTALARVALETQAGVVWLVRQTLLLLLALFLALGARVERRGDWLASRGETLLLGLLALALGSLGGHAAAVEPGVGRAIVVDALHLAAAGAWLGGLLPLAALVRRGASDAGAEARPYGVLAARRFSRAALVAVAVLILTGAIMTLLHVGDMAGLVGTPYGRLLLVKLGLVVLVLAVAALNRRRLPALSGDGDTVGRPAMRRMAAALPLEALLGFAVLAVATVMSTTPPARHEQPAWPFAFRLSLDAIAEAPASRARALVGSQVALLGVVAVLSSLALRRHRAAMLAGSGVLLAFGLGMALPPLAIDAFPLTYRRPSAPYHASSIAAGAALYAEHCSSCHGPTGAGDGRAGLVLPRPPADLRAPHTTHHTAGDLFWWISHGIPGSGMPGFAERLNDDERWDVVNFVRLLSASDAARRLGPAVEFERPRLVAPDATFAVGPSPARSLKDYRSQRIVVLVLYTLPESRARLTDLANTLDRMVTYGAEVVAVPRDGDPRAIKRLGGDPPILFPIVTEGAEAIVTTYSLFSRAPHAELLIDRQGYLRAISASERSWPDVPALLDQIERLNAEKTVPPPASEHVH